MPPLLRQRGALFAAPDSSEGALVSPHASVSAEMTASKKVVATASQPCFSFPGPAGIHVGRHSAQAQCARINQGVDHRFDGTHASS